MYKTFADLTWKEKRAPQDFNQMLTAYNQLQEEEEEENTEIQKAQAFWNLLESLSSKDAPSKK